MHVLVARTFDLRTSVNVKARDRLFLRLVIASRESEGEKNQCDVFHGQVPHTGRDKVQASAPSSNLVGSAVMFDTHQEERSWLKEDAWKKADCIAVTLDVSQSLMS